jgi:16S rRNA (guanine527-N7)-methyltransferase
MEVIAKYFPHLTLSQVEAFKMLYPLYLDWNEKINVISRKDIDNLYVNHILHSLSIAKIIDFVPGTSVLDVGTVEVSREFPWLSCSRIVISI